MSLEKYWYDNKEDLGVRGVVTDIVKKWIFITLTTLHVGYVWICVNPRWLSPT